MHTGLLEDKILKHETSSNKEIIKNMQDFILKICLITLERQFCSPAPPFQPVQHYHDIKDHVQTIPVPIPVPVPVPVPVPSKWYQCFSQNSSCDGITPTVWVAAVLMSQTRTVTVWISYSGSETNISFWKSSISFLFWWERFELFWVISFKINNSSWEVGRWNLHSHTDIKHHINDRWVYL